MLAIYAATTLIILAMVLLVEFVPRRIGDDAAQVDTGISAEKSEPEEKTGPEEKLLAPVVKKIEVTLDPTMFAGVQENMKVVKDPSLENFMKLYCYEHTNREGHDLVACVIGGFTVENDKVNVSVKEAYEDSVIQYVLYEIDALDMNYTVAGVQMVDSSGIVFGVPDNSIKFIPLEQVQVYSSGRAIETDPESLNDAGMNHYKKGEYELAAALFRGGTLLDGTTDDIKQLALCYYNLACTISILSETDENYDNLDECLSYLERSFALSPDRVARAQKDPDFDSIRNTQAFMELIDKYKM